MKTVVIQKNMPNKIEGDESVFEERERVMNSKIRQRIADIERDPTIGKSEEDLINYLKKRGVDVVHMDN